MSEKLTILRSSLRMAKLVRRDLTVEPYARAKHFRVDRFPVNGIAQLLVWMVTRGAPRQAH